MLKMIDGQPLKALIHDILCSPPQSDAILILFSLKGTYLIESFLYSVSLQFHENIFNLLPIYTILSRFLPMVLFNHLY